MRAVRPVSSLCAKLVAKKPWFLHAASKVSGQTGQADLTLRSALCHFVSFVMLRILSKESYSSLLQTDVIHCRFTLSKSSSYDFISIFFLTDKSSGSD